MTLGPFNKHKSTTKAPENPCSNKNEHRSKHSLRTTEHHRPMDIDHLTIMDAVIERKHPNIWVHQRIDHKSTGQMRPIWSQSIWTPLILLIAFIANHQVHCQFNDNPQSQSQLPPLQPQLPPSLSSSPSQYSNDFNNLITNQNTNIDMNSNEINNDLILPEPTYFIVASKIVRPGQVYRLLVTIYHSQSPIMVRASLKRNGLELSSTVQLCKESIPETLLLRMPTNSLPGDYRLWIEGNINEYFGGNIFHNETRLQFEQRFMTIFIMTDKPIYKQGQVVRFRAMPITTDLKSFTDAIDIYMLNPNGVIMRRWLSRQTNLGAISLEYPLSQQPVYGQNWTIKVVAQGQVETKQFAVEEFYQTRFEVNVSMAAFFQDTDPYIHGSVMANFTSGVPVIGNLTIVYTLQFPQFVGGNNQQQQQNQQPQQSSASFYERPAIETTERYFDGYYEFRLPMTDIIHQLANRQTSLLDGAMLTVTAYVGERFLNLIYSGYSKAIIFSSKIRLKFLGPQIQIFKPQMPFKLYCILVQSDGTPIRRSLKSQNHLSSSLLLNERIEVQLQIKSKTNQLIKVYKEAIQMSKYEYNLWEIRINLRKILNNDKNLLEQVQSLIVQAFYDDQLYNGVNMVNMDVNINQQQPQSSSKLIKSNELRLYASYSPRNRLIQITTSTNRPIVGQYIIFHVRTNYYMNLFNYLVISKGIILIAGREEMNSMLKTFTFTVTSEMSPTATIIVYDLATNGEIVADSLTFPVDGISSNNFTVQLNNRKDKSGDTIEIVVNAQPGSYVAISALDKDLFNYNNNNDNHFNYGAVQKKMISFDDLLPLNNLSLSYSWYSHYGTLDRYLYFPTSTTGIDTNQTFENSGLVIFTDANIVQRPNQCNHTRGLQQCMDNGCYHFSKKCDGRFDCRDGTDEMFCNDRNNNRYNDRQQFDLTQFHMTRTNRLQRLYDNNWLWNDVFIGPLGYYIFKLPVPNAPVNWLISSFGMSKTHGFSIQRQTLKYSSVRPFYMNVEMPSKCLLGEQIGIRISIFNYLPYEIEVVVILARSIDYKFVHVESLGRVQSYNPRTSFGQHQHLIMIYPSRTKIVYMPIVATRIGHINVTIMAKTQVAKDIVTKTLEVEPDGIPQSTHTSVVLDLSQGAYLIKYLETNVTESPIIPYRKERRYVFGSNRATVTIVGDAVGPAFPTIPMNATSMLRKPFDAAEPSMFSFAVNVYMLLYLRYTGQRKPEIEKEVFRYLNIDYQRQLSYQNPDGSFRAFRWHQTPSVWMTAFCARVLHLATFQEWENFLYIDPKVIQNAIVWLLRQQRPDGSFVEHPSQTSLNRRTNMTSNISLTAHVLITLAEVRHLSGDIDSRATSARTSAQRFLESSLHIVKDYDDPYELAIVTYALTLMESVEAVEGFNYLHLRMREVSGMRYWGKEPVAPVRTQVESNRPFILPRLPNRFDSSNVATTAYGLLIHIKRQAFIQKEIVEWLNFQRLYDSGWSTTEDTIIALQALIDYSNKDRLRDVTDITITIEAPASHNFSSMIHITEDNISQMQSIVIPNAYGAITVKAQGSGIALVQLNVDYCVDWPQFQIQPPIRSFDLDVSAQFTGRNSSHITFKSCQRWINTRESLRSGMAVLEVTIPTGYFIQQQDLDHLIRITNSHSNNLSNRLKEARYYERKAVFYFNSLDTSYTCISFTVQRWYPVANLTRYIPIRVYDYYAPERYNETMFSTQNLYYLSVCHVCGSYQCPYCPIFSAQFSKFNLNPFIISAIILFNVITMQLSSSSSLLSSINYLLR